MADTTTSTTTMPAWYRYYLSQRSSGVFRMEGKHDEINLWKAVITIALGLIGLVFNTYFLACIASLKSLRQWRYVLIGWQGLCDLIGISILGTFQGLLRFADYNTTILNWIDDTWGFRTRMDWLTYKACKFNEATRLINEYSTPLVLTFLAVERLIVVVFPFRAKQLLNKWTYMGCSIGIPIFTVSMVMGIFRGDNGRCGYSGNGGLYRDGRTKFLFDIPLLFALPAMACLVMYGLVAAKLLRKPATAAAKNKDNNADNKGKEKSEKEKRNILLCKCFFSTTVAWIVCWSYTYYWDSNTILEWRGRKEWTAGEYVLYLNRDLALYLYSVINPVIFIIVNRQFQQPIKMLVNKVKKCTGDA
ncbi:uncharacterized protein LOC134851798 [Symsagittifera roscoffensis]|uniref:uncharacterized protein LOC134851798 n=1 Tax=Symsagittifera roscoffensis TaxID=84072 RepID=UPI00307BD916